jgi:hypothetical protein
MKATDSQRRLAVGEHVKIAFGAHEYVGRIVEDRGFIGVRGRQLVRVETYLPHDEVITLEVPAEELSEARCRGGHFNGFRHFDPGVASLDAYDLGIKLMDDNAPPPPGSPSEPRLYVFVSVLELEPDRDFGTIHYARSRSLLRDGFPSSEDDRSRLTADILERLEADVRELVAGKLATSEEDPIFVQGA